MDDTTRQQLNTYTDDINTIISNVSTLQNSIKFTTGKFAETKHLTPIPFDLNLPYKIEVSELTRGKGEKGFFVKFSINIAGKEYIKIYSEGLGSSLEWYENIKID